jgi:hypothetical protein
LQVEAMQRLVQREIRLEHSAEPAALYLAAGEQPARAILQWSALPRAPLAQPE